MKKENKKLTPKEIEDRLKELKMGLLKQGAKRNGIKKGIARLLTMKNQIKLLEAEK